MNYKRRILISLAFFAVFFFAVSVIGSFEAVTTFDPDSPVDLPILMYHSVNPDKSKTGKYVITPESFEADLEYLESRGYTSVSAKQLIKYVYNNEPLPEKPFLLTFDDGMYNNFKYVVPILKKHDAHAVFSVVGAYTDEYSENNITNDNYSYMRWCDIDSLVDSDNVEFGNHSYNFHSISALRHGSRKNKYEAPLDYIKFFDGDMQKMQSEFYSNCNFRLIIYTYPYGAYSKESEHVLKKNGFMMTLSCIEGVNKISHDGNCLYLMKRFNRPGNMTSGEFFARKKL